mgnify:CR=1 FL=1|tara:strand:+ start:172 stop:345 length:174 start_codon:yes stop_codon:yes gene_type:complete
MDENKIQQRKEYMRNYYKKKKKERVAAGKPLTSKNKKLKNPPKFSITRGEFIISFSN